MALSSALDDTLYRIYSSLETEFLTTIVDGELAMKDFAKRLSNLKLQDSSAQDFSPCPSQSTAAIAYRAASSISIISSSFMEVESISKDFENDLFTDVTDILQHLTIQDRDSLSDIDPIKETQGKGMCSVKYMYNI